ncbi:LacI family DNA-binding transcriptional regulator [Pantoea sp. 1.19]|uniref:LacI family DNA-binding transcriptional regulator n=1 Tax=Pantoea sp. 1.19 TaxID=1925589 RepID=UPI000948FDBB|nr:LacI family DNA-binding transcriptional regulator [Pantoea sp. 1.19]
MKERRRRTTGKSTLADVARRVGVSSMTASRALRMPDKVSPALREKIDAAIAELGYVPNLAASGLASASSRLIVMLVSSLSAPGCASVFEALQRVLTAKGYLTMLVEADIGGHDDPTLPEKLLAYNPAAIVLYGYACGEQGRRLLVNAGLPVVDVGCVNDESVGISIGVDFSAATRELVAALTARGWRHLALLCTQNHPVQFRQIMAGWHSGMLAKNHAPHRVVTSAEPPTIATGYRLLHDIRLTWPEVDALICTSDEVACGALMACHAEGIAIPSQLALASLGGGHLTAVCSPPLTTVALPWQEMGQLAGEQLLALLQDGEGVARAWPLATRLVLRASSGKSE